MGFTNVLSWIVFVGLGSNLNAAHPLIQDFGPDMLPSEILPLSAPQPGFDFRLIPVQPSGNKDSLSFLSRPTYHDIGAPEFLPPDVELVPPNIMLKGDRRPIIPGNDDTNSAILPPDVEILPGSYFPMTYYIHHNFYNDNRRPDASSPPYVPPQEPSVWTLLSPNDGSTSPKPVPSARPSYFKPITIPRYRSAPENIETNKIVNCSQNAKDSYFCLLKSLTELILLVQEMEQIDSDTADGLGDSLLQKRSSQTQNVKLDVLPQRLNERRALVSTIHEAGDTELASTEPTRNQKHKRISLLRRSASSSNHPDKKKRDLSGPIDRLQTNLVRNMNPKNWKSRSLRETNSEDDALELLSSTAELLLTDADREKDQDRSETFTGPTENESQESDVFSTFSWDFDEVTEKSFLSNNSEEVFSVSGSMHMIQPENNEDENSRTSTVDDNGEILSDVVRNADLIDSALDEVGHSAEIEDVDTVLSTLFDDDVTESITGVLVRESDAEEEDTQDTRLTVDDLEIFYGTTTNLPTSNYKQRMEARSSDEDREENIEDLHDANDPLTNIDSQN